MTNYKRVKTKKDVQTADGFLKKGTKVKVDEIADRDVRVVDATGRIFWLDKSDLALQLIFIIVKLYIIREAL